MYSSDEMLWLAPQSCSATVFLVLSFSLSREKIFQTRAFAFEALPKRTEVSLLMDKGFLNSQRFKADSHFTLHPFDSSSQRNKFQPPILHKTCVQNELQKEESAAKFSLGDWHQCQPGSISMLTTVTKEFRTLKFSMLQ